MGLRQYQISRIQAVPKRYHYSADTVRQEYAFHWLNAWAWACVHFGSAPLTESLDVKTCRACLGVGCESAILPEK